MTPAPDLTLGTAVDWRFAATVGRRLARPGPPSTDYTRRQVIDELAGAATKAEPLVRQVTGLLTDGADDGRVPAARIVDRPEWIAAAAESMRVMMNGTERPRGFLTGRVTGAQTGAVLAYVSSGILGQYDPFATDRGPARVACCWSTPTSSPSSGSCGSSRPISGCGSACTRSPIASSSPPTPGCPATCRRRWPC